MIEELPKYMLLCLSITIAVEMLCSIFLGLRKKDLVNVLLANILTNPLVVVIPIAVLFYYNRIASYISLFILEVLTVIVEGIIYKKYLNNRKINAFVLALILNVLSFLVGLVVEIII